MKALVLLVVVAACSRSGIAPIVVAPVVPLSPAPIFEPEEPRGRVVVVDTSIEILEGITFIGNTAQLAPTSSAIIEAVARTMEGNPSILLMQVRGHSDSEEPDPRVRAELSIQRAQAVVAELVARGVNEARLDAYGASDSEPLSTDPLINRRVAFLILERSTD